MSLVRRDDGLGDTQGRGGLNVERWLSVSAFVLALFATVLILYETFVFQNRILVLERQIAVNDAQLVWLDKYGGQALRDHHLDPVSRAHPIEGNVYGCVVQPPHDPQHDLAPKTHPDTQR